MNGTTNGALSRRKLLEAAGTAAAAVAAASLAGPAAGATPTRVSFQAKMEGPPPPAFEIPVRPLIRSVHLAATGESDLLGQFQWASHVLFRPSIDDTIPTPNTDGIGAMTATNGDAVFFSFSGLTRGTGPGLVETDSVFTITGGSGKFCGAVGSGTIHDAVDFNKGRYVQTMNGVILLPA
jgi:hypothetical protein